MSEAVPLQGVVWPTVGRPIVALPIAGGIILIAEQRSEQQRWEQQRWELLRPTAPTDRAITIKVVTATPTTMCNVPSIDALTGASDSGRRNLVAAAASDHDRYWDFDDREGGG